MNAFTKWILMALLLLFMAAILWGCYKVFILGNYLANASFITSGLLILGAVSALYVSLWAIRTLLKNKTI